MFPKLFGSYVLALSLVIPAVVRAADPQVIDGIAAVVNGDVITFSQVQEVAASEEQTLRQQYQGQELIDKIKETRLAVLNDLVNRQLILQEFKKKEYKIPDYVVEQQVAGIIKDEFGGDPISRHGKGQDHCPNHAPKQREGNLRAASNGDRGLL